METLSKQDTTSFQTWFNDHKASETMKELTVDGIYGPKTATAYKAEKDAYDNRITLGRIFMPRFTIGSMVGIAVGIYIIHRIRKTTFKEMKPTILIPLEIGILVAGNTIGQAIQNKISY